MDPLNKNSSKPTGDDFYREAIRTVEAARIPFLVGGAYALRVYAGIQRDTKDFDIFLRERDLRAALDEFERQGFRTEIPYPHWLAKAYHGEWFIDFIFRAGNGLCDVDDEWFRHTRTRRDEVLGEKVSLVPVEEMIWMKAFIMERERFDGADIAHMLRSVGDQLDWNHLLKRFGSDWRLLLSHIILFGFVYPSERDRVPKAVLDELLGRLSRESASTPPTERICRGTLISREQYLPDIEWWDYRDARLEPRVKMSGEHLALWTEAIEGRIGAPGREPSH